MQLWRSEPVFMMSFALRALFLLLLDSPSAVPALGFSVIQHLTAFCPLPSSSQLSHSFH